MANKIKLDLSKDIKIDNIREDINLLIFNSNMNTDLMILNNLIFDSIKNTRIEILYTKKQKI